MEYQITDRLSFKRFLDLKSSDRIPDSKTIWKLRETLIQEEVIEALFYRFNQALDDQSIFVKTGLIVDTSFVEVPKQRYSRGEYRQNKQDLHNMMRCDNVFRGRCLLAIKESLSTEPYG